MLITKHVLVMVQQNQAILDQELYFYQNDRNIDVYFEIKNFNFDFKRNENVIEDVIESSGATYSCIKILKPNGDKIITDRLDLEEGQVKLVIGDDFMDEEEEVGEYYLQIQLFDEDTGRVSVPPFKMTVLKSLFDAEYDTVEGMIDLTNIGDSTIADDNINSRLGAYNINQSNLKSWHTGDLISSYRMNLIHQNIDEMWNILNNLKAEGIRYANEKYENVQEALDNLLYEPLTVTTTANYPFLLEKGEEVVNPILSWEYNKDDIELQLVNDNEVNVDIREMTMMESFTYNRSYIITAKDSIGSVVGKWDFIFGHKVYWGSSDSVEYGEQLIQSLEYNTLSTTKSRTIEVTAGSTQYIYYAYPMDYNNTPPTFTVGGFDGGFEQVAYFMMKNQHNYTTQYVLYRSDNVGLGKTTIVVK